MEKAIISEYRYQMLINPLDIPHILSTIFTNLSVWNLKKCRTICKSWYEESTPILLRRSKISFKSEEQLSELSTLEISNVSRFCQTFDISNEINLYSPSVYGFFKKFSKIVKSLDLSFHHEYSSSWILHVFPRLVNLEELCLNGRATWIHEETETIGDLQLEMTFSKLKFLFIYDSSYELESPLRRRIWIENIFQVLLAACNLERLFFAPFMETRAKTFFEIITSSALAHKSISHLHINHLSATPLELNLLVGKNYPLKYVHLVLTHNLKREELNSFLHKLKGTLRELTLTFTDGVTCTQFHPIEPLNNLLKLSLIGYEGPLVTCGAEKLQLFVVSLPEPSEDSGSNGGGFGPMGLRVNRDLRELEIYDSKGKYCLGTLRRLYNHFGSLRSLKMNNVDNGILRLVYTHLGSLCELHICFHKFYGVSSVQIDGGLCGIPDYMLNDECLLDCMDLKSLSHLRAYPWIGVMKNLKLLELELGHLTDFGVILGIARSPSIRKLVLKNCDRVFDDSTQGIMTDRSIEAISEFMNLHYLKLEGYNECFSEETIKTVQQKMDGIETYFI